MDASSSAKLTPEIFRKMQQQVVERMGDIQIPPEAIHYVEDPKNPFAIKPEEETLGSVPGMLCLLAQTVRRVYGDNIKSSFPSIQSEITRARALESLWAAVKELNADETGYTPKMAEAVARLRKLEAGQ